MNFSDFSFWWVLLLYSVPFFTIRYLAKSLNLWQDTFDVIGLVVMSLVLFLNASRTSFSIFVFDVVINYVMVAWMLRLEGWKAKLLATLLIIFNVSILAYFKYLVFFVEHILGKVIAIPPHWQSYFPLLKNDYIPPGLSFYTFEMIAFTVDSLKAKKKKKLNFLDYVNFMTFFPKIVAGPIERRLNLLPQLEYFRLKFTVENFEKGFRWLSLGVFMKFVLSDNLAPYIDLSNAENPWIIWLITFLFTLRIYFDFAGYSFIAVGLAWFLGIRLTLNFLAPYTSVSINEFWQRWHITLSTWFRDYVFLPLMGTKKQFASFFLFITFTLSGFWHGAAWNFVLWGAYHGGLLLLLRYVGRPFHKLVGKYVSRSQFISWALTFFSVTLGCLFFVDSNTHRLFTKLKTLATPWAYSLNNLQELFNSYFSPDNFNHGVLLSVIILLSLFVLLMEHIAVWQQKFEYEILLSNWLSPVLLGLTILLAANQPSQFIYFEF
jgi:D-alanyl-lipoteichoic acid acyltransferase DltB (MBOAT superfamily)